MATLSSGITIDVRSNIADVARNLELYQKEQLPFATALALTETAKDIRVAQRKEMRDVFDRPTPFTLNSLFLQAATKRKMTAVVWLKDSGRGGANPTNYLTPQIFGGTRNAKAFEIALRRSRHAAGLGPFFAVPGSAAKLDAYGNMSRGQIVQILSDLQLLEQRLGAKQNRLTRREVSAARAAGRKVKFKPAKYFIGRPGNSTAPLGVYEHIRSGFGGGIRPVLIFVNSVHYERRWDFQFVSQLTYDREFSVNLAVALRKALDTARPTQLRKVA